MTVRFEGESLQLSGAGAAPTAVTLRGSRADVDGEVTATADGWVATVPLRASRWSGPVLPLPSGQYSLEIDGTNTDSVLDGAALPATILRGLRAELDGSSVRIGPPVDPAYDSGDGQDALERRYASRPAAVEDAIFLESFYGRSISCNPRAIDERLSELAPSATRYWSVVDLSIPVPEGAIAVVDGSPEWWRARGHARLLVVNDWLRRRFSRRAGQRVLQTWHGTPLKRLALQRPGFDPRRTLAVLRESRRWDHLLAQNPYTAQIFRRGYAYRRPIWVEGYPRNDILVNGSGVATRKRLGIGEDERVLLYAPTWRDDRELMVDHLDAEALARDTGAVVLVRGHSRTLQPGTDARGARVIDVTSYPETSELLLVADTLITDYSSVMFDFSVTGKPIVFYVPDLEHYRGDLRGFYFDVEERAPGPVVQTQAALVDALAESPDAYRDRYALWKDVFNARDDGRASERVVARILDQGLIPRG